MTFTFILTMNGDFDVHRAGCSDIKKVRKCGEHNVEAETVDVAIAEEVADLNADFGEGAWSTRNFRTLPCTRRGEAR
jgi:hypothetical protein